MTEKVPKGRGVRAVSFKDTALFKWLDNYWYHYKWRTIIIGTFAIIILVCVIQSVRTPDFDAGFLYAGPYVMSSAEVDSFNDAMRNIMRSDYNGDGKRDINIVSMGIMSDEQIMKAVEVYGKNSYPMLYKNYSYEVMLKNFYTEAYTGESMLGCIDEGLYGLLLERNSLYTLEEVLGYVPEGAFSEYGIYLKDTDAGSFFSVFTALPDDTVICFRKPSSTSIFRTKSSEKKRYDSSVKLFEDFLAFKAPEQAE